MLAEGNTLPQREAHLLRAAKYLGRFSDELVETTARLVLGNWSTKEAPLNFQSRLNNDGSPLQLCLSVSIREQAIRLLGDPGSQIVCGRARCAYAIAVLDNILSISTDSVLTVLARDMLAISNNLDSLNYSAGSAGPLWLAKPFIGKGVAVYTNAGWGSPASRWERVRLWLESFAPARSSTRDIFEKLALSTEVASIGLEGCEGASCRGKVYFRLHRSRRLSELGLDLLATSGPTGILKLLMCDRELPLSGIVFCIGISRLSGEVVDAKIDVCGHCLSQSTLSWERTLRHCTDLLRMPPFSFSGELLENEVAFVGLGVSRESDMRMNLYLKGHV